MPITETSGWLCYKCWGRTGSSNRFVIPGTVTYRYKVLLFTLYSSWAGWEGLVCNIAMRLMMVTSFCCSFVISKIVSGVRSIANRYSSMALDLVSDVSNSDVLGFRDKASATWLSFPRRYRISKSNSSKRFFRGDRMDLLFLVPGSPNVTGGCAVTLRVEMVREGNELARRDMIKIDQ